MCGLAWGVRRPLWPETVGMREAKLEGGSWVASAARSPTVRHRPAGSPLALRLPEGRLLALTTGTGPGPEGSRPTVGGRRSQGCGAEEGYEGLARNNGAHREHARTL